MGQTWQGFVWGDRSLLFFFKSSGRPLERFDQEEAVLWILNRKRGGGGDDTGRDMSLFS